MSRSWKDHSRISWSTTGDPDNVGPSDERLKIGCLQRIADATELMARNFLDLQRRAEWAETRAKDLRAEVERLSRSNAALRGHLRRAKKQEPKP